MKARVVASLPNGGHMPRLRFLRIVRAKLMAGLNKFRPPTADNAGVFSKIYANSRWGGEDQPFYSGPGSHTAEVIIPYVEAVARYIQEHNAKTIVDIGCGDFSVGSELLKRCPEVDYIGVDVVEDLIEFNNTNFGTDKIRFKCTDASDGDLPPGDTCLIRQVLQHLSNDTILRVMQNVNSAYEHVIVTEHFPARTRSPNLDKRTGGDTRVGLGSAVYLDKPPFSLNGLKQILSVEDPSPMFLPGETIQTQAFRNW